MEKHIDQRVILLAAEKIRSNGKPVNDGYSLDGITLNISYDGYTVHLKSSTVSLTLFFHNKFEADAANQSDLDLFYRQLEAIANSDDTH